MTDSSWNHPAAFQKATAGLKAWLAVRSDPETRVGDPKWQMRYRCEGRGCEVLNQWLRDLEFMEPKRRMLMEEFVKITDAIEDAVDGRPCS